MYVRVSTGQIQQGKLQEAIDIANDSVVPAAKARKGFQALYFMTNPENGKFLALSVWETEADMVAIENDGFSKEQYAKLGALIEHPTPLTEKLRGNG